MNGYLFVIYSDDTESCYLSSSDEKRPELSDRERLICFSPVSDCDQAMAKFKDMAADFIDEFYRYDFSSAVGPDTKAGDFELLRDLACRTVFTQAIKDYKLTSAPKPIPYEAVKLQSFVDQFNNGKAGASDELGVSFDSLSKHLSLGGRFVINGEIYKPIKEPKPAGLGVGRPSKYGFSALSVGEYVQFDNADEFKKARGAAYVANTRGKMKLRASEKNLTVTRVE